MSSTPPPRRNDPCPCGSGLRFKECHGRLDAAVAPAVNSVLQGALQFHQQGRVEEAAKRYRQVLQQDPRNAVATHYLGMTTWQRGNPAEAERLMREALSLDNKIPDFHNNLGLLLRDTQRLDEAMQCFNAALAIDPRWYEAYNNVGLTLESADRFNEACDAYRKALTIEPRFAAAHQNLGRALVTQGEYRAGWEEYRWRLLAQGTVQAPPDLRQTRFPASLEGRQLALRGEQGIGDVLFFLRFSPELTRRGARLAFRGDPRLHGMLTRTGHFDLGMGDERMPAPDCEAIFVGDLPWLLDAHEAAHFPPSLHLPALTDRVERMRATLSALGPGPYVGLTWRAGTVVTGPVRTQSKQLTAEVLANYLGDRKATWISVQRLPAPGELEAMEKALGARVHDLSAANQDLEEILAAMAVLDDYVGVSNVNTHLRAGLGLPMTTLIPFPPEWRWGSAGERSPWFPTVKVVRQKAGGTW